LDGGRKPEYPEKTHRYTGNVTVSRGRRSRTQMQTRAGARSNLKWFIAGNKNYSNAGKN